MRPKACQDRPHSSQPVPDGAQGKPPPPPPRESGPGRQPGPAAATRPRSLACLPHRPTCQRLHTAATAPALPPPPLPRRRARELGPALSLCRRHRAREKRPCSRPARRGPSGGEGPRLRERFQREGGREGGRAGRQLEWKIPGRSPREPGRRQRCPPTQRRAGFLREGRPGPTGGFFPSFPRAAPHGRRAEGSAAPGAAGKSGAGGFSCFAPPPGLDGPGGGASAEGSGRSPLPGGRRLYRSAERTLFSAPALPRGAERPVPLPSLLLRLPSLSPPSSASRGPSFPRHRAVYKSPFPGVSPPTAGDPGTLAPGAGACRQFPDRQDFALPPLTAFPPLSSSLSSPAGLPRTVPTGLFPSLTGIRMSEKRVEEAPAELSAKEIKEKKEKLEEKAAHKEKKKEVVEDEENGAEEDEEENPDDVDEEEGGDEDEEGDENGQEQDGHAGKRSAEEEEDEVDPKRQKTENGSSA
ncbi:parathymosin [Opisthocomus hoazin]|uniref:parathymosin n=1 Tax=Opisthocomus hoazin TaxID=30419 RepID=UPI003F539D01